MGMILKTSDDTLVPITKEYLTWALWRKLGMEQCTPPTSSRNEVVRFPAPSSRILFVFSMVGVAMGLGSSFAWFAWPRLALTEGK